MRIDDFVKIKEDRGKVKIVHSYSFWKHPIQWWKDRKSINAMQDIYNEMLTKKLIDACLVH